MGQSFILNDENTVSPKLPSIDMKRVLPSNDIVSPYDFKVSPLHSLQIAFFLQFLHIRLN